MSERTKTPRWMTMLFVFQTTIICLGLFEYLRPRFYEQHFDALGGVKTSTPEPAPGFMYPSPSFEKREETQVLASSHAKRLPNVGDHADRFPAADIMPSAINDSEPSMNDKSVIAVEPPFAANHSTAGADLERARLPHENPGFLQPETDAPGLKAHSIVTRNQPGPVLYLNLLDNAADMELLPHDGPSEVSTPTAASDRNARTTPLENEPAVPKDTVSEQQQQSIYHLRNSKSSEVARTIRDLFANSAKVAADDNSQSLIVIASEETAKRIEALVRMIEERAAEIAEERRALFQSQLAENREARFDQGNDAPTPHPPERNAADSDRSARRPTPVPTETDSIAKREEALLQDEISLKNLSRSLGAQHPRILQLEQRIKLTRQWLEEHRNDERRTLIFKVAGRDTKEIVSALNKLFGQDVKIAVDEPTSSLLISVDPTRSGVQARALLREIETIVTQLTGTAVVVPAVVPNLAAAAMFPADEQDTVIDREARQLAAKIRAAKPEDRASLRKELEALTAKQFEHRQQRRKQEFEQLSQRLERLKANHQRRQEHRAEVIERRVNDLLDPNADLRWDETELTDDRLISEKEGGGKQRIETAANQPAHESSDDSSSSVVIKSNEPDPTFNGVTLAEWFRLLDSERNTTKIAEAVNAMNALRDEAEPRKLVRAIMKMMRVQGTETLFQATATIMGGSAILLKSLPADIVVDELTTEAVNFSGRKPTRDFLSYFLREIYQGPQGIFGNNGSNTQQMTATKSLRQEIQLRSRKLVGAFAAAADRDGTLEPWTIICSFHVIRTSQQLITTFPELIPIAERHLPKAGESVPPGQVWYHRQYAAILLGQANLHVPEILTVAQQKIADQNQTPAVQLLVAIAPHSPQAVDTLAATLRTEWSIVADLYDKQQAESDQNDKHQALVAGPEHGPQINKCLSLASALGDIGIPAKPAIPLLEEIVASAKSNISISNAYFPQPLQALNLRDAAMAAIKKIESARPALPLVPLDEVASVTSASDVLKPGASSDETTYDGITYSQWLKLLETERKPEKLIAAIDTCARLAAKGDERKITRLILRAESFFESDKWQSERQKAADAGYQALGELPGEIVIDELLAALVDTSTEPSRRTFQLYYFNQPGGFSHWAEAKQRATEIISALLKLVPAEMTEESYLTMAAASSVWRLSERPLANFDGLTQRIDRMLDEGYAQPQSPASYHWLRVMDNLVNQAPATPDLALKLMKQAQRHGSASEKIVGLLSPLHQAAEPAVPGLVELFLSESKKISTDPDMLMAMRSMRATSEAPISEKLRLSIGNALGNFDSGDLGYALLQPIAALAPDTIDRQPMLQGGYSNQVIVAAKDSLAKLAQKRSAPPEGTLKSDFLTLSDTWRLKGLVAAGTDPAVEDNVFVRVRLNEWKWVSLNVDRGTGRGSLSKQLAAVLSKFETRATLWQVTMDETTNPRQITLVAAQPRGSMAMMGNGGAPNPETQPPRWEGIYDLNGNTLMIQIANPSHPRPTRFCEDSHDLPEHERLLEFVREPQKSE